MLRAIERRYSVVAIDILGNHNHLCRTSPRSGKTHTNVLRIGVSNLKCQPVAHSLVELGLERIVDIFSPRLKLGNVSRIILNLGKKLASSASADLTIINLYWLKKLNRVRADVSHRGE